MSGRFFTLRLLRSSLHPSPHSVNSSLISVNGLLNCRLFSSRRPSAASKEKSLIDDEAELSDWIGDLKTHSVNFRLSSDDEDGVGERRTNVRGSRGSSSARKERFYSDSDEDEGDGRFGSGRGRGGARGGRGQGFGSGRDKGFSDNRGFSGGRDKGFSGGRDKGFRDDRGFSSGRDKGFNGDRGFSGGRDKGFRGRKESSFDLSDEEKGFRGHMSGGAQRGGRGGKSLNSRRDMDRRESTKFDYSDEETGFKNRGGAQVSQRGRRNVRESGFGSSNEERGFKAQRTTLNKSKLSEQEEEEDASDAGFSDPEEFLKESLDLEKNEKVVKSSNEGEDLSYLSQKRFDECSLSELTLKGLKSAGYERMTVVQEATLPVILQGKDVLAKARTGTGKTVAFLLPSIELLTKLPPLTSTSTKPQFNILIICPTRELADQAAQEAKKLVKTHASISVQLVIGGTRLGLEQKNIQTKPSQILVGTPGRLKDHAENTPGFASRLKGIRILVLDEADRLLDMGFRKDIEKIIEHVPKQRQTLLFSATVPDEVKQMCYIALKRDFEFINTVEEGSEETHAQVKQMHIVSPLENQFRILYGLLKDHISENIDYKVIVFCTTAMMTRLVSEYLSELKLNVREIHSRKPQSYRTRISKEFKEAKGLILVSSDVSARGVDYPDVTLVIQIGVPADREQYIHRLGRTGRKGKEGTGILILAPWENYFLRIIKDLPISQSPLPLIDPNTKTKVERALAHVDEKDKEKAYQAWLGYYNSNKNVGKDKYELVSLANEFSRTIGMDNPPAIPKLILRKMGLNNIPGLRTK